MAGGAKAVEHLIEHVKHAPRGAGTTSAAATLAATVDPPERRGVGTCTFPSPGNRLPRRRWRRAAPRERETKPPV